MKTIFDQDTGLVGPGLLTVMDDRMVRTMARGCGCLDRLESVQDVVPRVSFLLERLADGKWALFVRWFGFPDACDNGFMAVLGDGSDRDRERLGRMARSLERRMGGGTNAMPSMFTASSDLTVDDVREMLRHIPSRPDYETWTRIISAAGAALPADEAAAVLNEWSPEERRGEYVLKLRNRLKSVGVGTLVRLAVEGGYDAKEGARRRRGGGMGAPAVPIRRAPPVTPVAPKPRAGIKWPADMHRGTDAELEALAKLRGIPGTEGLEAATMAGNLWFCTLRDLDEMDCWTWRPAWLLTDSARRIALARRLDGRAWWGVRAKGWLLRGSRGNWAVGAPDIGEMPKVMLTEGGPDFLCAWHYIASSGEEWAPVCMASGSARIAAETLPAFAGRTVLIMAHNDEAGRMALCQWSGQLQDAGAERVASFNFAKWRNRTDGGAINDLNDFLRADAGGTLERA